MNSQLLRNTCTHSVYQALSPPPQRAWVWGYTKGGFNTQDYKAAYVCMHTHVTNQLKSFIANEKIECVFVNYPAN